VFEAYMSPGSVTEVLHFFVAEYSGAQRIATGGGVDEEDIAVLEMPFADAMAKIASGEIQDGKRSCCCSTQRCTSSIRAHAG
jgi:GDP-mannose pyrophosphatase NudK